MIFARRRQIPFSLAAICYVPLLLLLESAIGFQPPTQLRHHHHHHHHRQSSRPLRDTITTIVAARRSDAGIANHHNNRQQPLQMVVTEVMSSGSTSAAVGRWEEVEGNFVLRPSVEDGPPRALGKKQLLIAGVLWTFELVQASVIFLTLLSSKPRSTLFGRSFRRGKLIGSSCSTVSVSYTHLTLPTICSV